MDTTSRQTPVPRKIVFAALGLLAGLLAFYAAVIVWTLGDASLQDAVGRWVYDAVVFGAALLVLARAASIPAERGAWLALGAGMLFWALGQTYYSVVLYYASPAPFPSPADFGFLAFYPASYLALVLLLRARVAHLERLAWVDGLIGALAVAGVAAALIFPPALEALEGSPFGVAVSLAYPCFDLVLLGMLSGAFAASKWKTHGSWLLIAGALLLFVACDVVYLSVAGQSTTALNIASVGWPLAFLLLAGASWLPATATGAVVGRAERRRIVVPIAMGMVGIALLAVGTFVPIGAAAVVCGVACLVAVLMRLLITFEQNTRMLRVTETRAVTDALTGLANRRHFHERLQAEVARAEREGRALSLILFDVDDFKSINDGFGHPAGDAALRGFAALLRDEARVSDVVCRVGGEEFAVLLPSTTAAEAMRYAVRVLLASRCSALRPDGRALTASAGVANTHADGPVGDELLRVADDRLLAAKAAGKDRVECGLAALA